MARFQNERIIVKCSLNEQEQNTWNTLKNMVGISEDSKLIKFMLLAIYDQWDHYNQFVPKWFLDRKLVHLNYGYKPSNGIIKTYEQTNKGLIEKNKVICVPENMPNSTTK